MPLPVIAGLSSIAVRVGGSVGKLVLRSFVGGIGGPSISTKVKWNGPHVQRSIRKGMGLRIKLAAEAVKNQTKRNIRRPVQKIKGPRSGRVQVVPSSRSKAGEFPKQDTTRLWKDIYSEKRGEMEAIIGTTLDYGLILETRMDRSFLKRTLIEMRPSVNRILKSGPRLPGQV